MSVGQMLYAHFRGPMNWILFLLAVFILLVTGCRPTEPELIVATEVIQLGDEQIVITRLVEVQPTEPPTAPPPARPPEPVVLDIAYEELLPNLDPQRVSGKAGLDLVESLFAGLVNFNHESEQVEPELAESWQVSGDGRTWTFALRDDVYWVKPIGVAANTAEIPDPEIFRAVSAEDVVYAITRACIQENGITDAFLLFVIDGCEAIYSLQEVPEGAAEKIGVTALDERTIQFTLNNAASNFLTVITLPQFRPVPHDLVEEFGDEWRDAIDEMSDGWQTPENLVVNGPFVPIADSLSDTMMQMSSNPLWPLQPRGNVDKVNAAFDVDELDMFQSWQNRELDLSVLPVSQREEFLESAPEKALLITNQTIFYVGFNFDSPVFAEPAIRRSFAAAINRDDLIDGMLDGRALGLRHLTPPGVFGAPAVDEVGLGYSPDFALQQMDLSSIRSCKLLPPVTMLVSTADLSLLQAESLRDMWVDELGCAEQLIQIDQVDFGMLLANTLQSAGSRPDMWELAWPTYYPDAHNVLFDALHCSRGENRQNRRCSELDTKMQQAQLTTDPQERTDLYRQVENGFFSAEGSFPLIPLYVRGDYLLVQSWLSFPPALSGGEQFDTFTVDQETKRLERSRG